VPKGLTARGPLGALLGLGSDNAAAHSLMLKRGLVRVFLPVPANAEYTLQLVSDAPGCNTDPNYGKVTDPGTGATTQLVSVYRRPLASANLRFATVTPGNIMWDGREPSLESQAIDATLGHAQALSPPIPAQVQQMVAFESGFFSAQAFDARAGSLTDGGATGGPRSLAGQAPVPAFDPVALPFKEYAAWGSAAGPGAAARQSIARGEAIFDTRTFTVANVAGFNDLIGSNAVPVTCSTCHNERGGGNDPFPNSQRDIGVGGQSLAFGGPAPSGDLPVFRLTCKGGLATPFNGPVVTTNDPGLALITGKCADIGKRTVPPLRGLASREPFFSNGSAATTLDVVSFYDRRFSIGLSAQEKQDLANFLNAL
jgi:cytochrome c peroxidase